MVDNLTQVIREFNDRGVIWLLSSPTNLRNFLTLAAPEIAEKLDFDRIHRENRSFINNNLTKKEVDLLFKLPFRYHDTEALVYIHIEDQTKPENIQGWRIYCYRHDVWKLEEQNWKALTSPDPNFRRPDFRLTPIIPIVFYVGTAPWNTPIGLEVIMDVPKELEEFIPKSRILRINLRDIPPLALVYAENGLALALRGLQAVHEPFHIFQEVITDLTRRLDKFPESADNK